MKTRPALLRYPAYVATLLAAVIASSSAIQAAGTFTWSGATSGSWSTATNWDAAITSDNQTDLVFNTTTKTLATSANGSYIGNSRIARSLTFGSGINAGISISLNFFNTQNSDLTMSANTGNASITVNSGATGGITIGLGTGMSSGFGNLVLSSNLDVVHNGSGQLTFNRGVTSTGALTKTGTGTLAFTGGTVANTYSGLTTVSGGGLTLSKTAGTDAVAGNVLVNTTGTLTFAASNQIKDTSNVEVATGGTVAMATFADTVNGLKLTGGTISGGGSLTSTTTLDLQSGSSATALNSTAGATKSTTGTMLITAASTISGAINVNAGTLELRAYNTLTGSTLNVNTGGTLYASTSGATGQDINSASGVNLAGGILKIGSGSVASSKAYDTVPITVSSASTLIYDNAAGYTIVMGLTGTAGFVLNNNLLLQHTAANTGVVNGINISRAITGTGNMTVETYNNIASNTASYSLGRVLLSGDNSGWSGNLEVAKGTVSLSGNSVNSAGTGGIVIGTTSDAFGAGLTFFPTSGNATTATYANAITVRSGGFRSIKGSNTDHNITFTGNVGLEGTLNVDHTLSAAGRRMTFSGNISGAGGLDITNAAGNANTGVIFDGTNTYLVATTVASGAALGGDGSIASNISFASGAKFVFSTTATLDVTGNVTFGSFNVSNLVGLDSATLVGSYLLLNGTGANIDFTNVSNIGSGSAYDLGNGVSAYFNTTNGDLGLIVASAVPEPSTFALLGGVAVLGFAGLRRRRRML